MRAVVALGLARQVVVSSASVSSTLAGFQKFTDKMVAKYGQVPEATLNDLDSASTESERATGGTDGTDNSQDTVTQVAGAGGTDHTAGVTDDDKQQILDVITWLEGLDQELLDQHVEDDNLQKECQTRLNLCESVDHDETKGASFVGGKVAYFEIGSHLTQGLGGEVGLAGRSVLSPATPTPNPDRTVAGNLAVCAACTNKDRTLSANNMPKYETSGPAAVNDTSATITAFAENVEPAHYSSGAQQTDGIGVVSGQFGTGSPQTWAGGAPWTNVITRSGTNKCSYMTQLTQFSADATPELQMYGYQLDTDLSVLNTGLQLDAFYSPTESDGITTPSDLVVKSGDFKGTQEFLASEQDSGYTECGSRWTQMTEFEMRHESCRRNHQQVACADQKLKCDSYDTCRASVRQTTGAPAENDALCYQFPSCAIQGGDHAAPQAGAGDLRDEYISTEWWFKERKTMETCLEKTTQWFVPLWDKYELCDQAIKYCAEATLTCDNIQWEFEARHCEWDKARKASCDAHYECYEKEVRRCAQTCDIVKLRERGRKAEFEIIQRIICMLKALLANNDEHYDSGERTDIAYSHNNTVADGGTGSFRIAADRDSDYGSKKERLNRCRTATPDSSQFNLFCQGPKVKDAAGEFAVGDQFSHYRHWSLEKGGEYPRLPNQVNGVCATGGACTDFVGQILVDDAEWAYDTTDPSTASTKYYRPYSKKDSSGADCTTGTDCKYQFANETQKVVAKARVDGSYTPWGFDCDFSDRPCTHQFILDHYNFLNAANTPNMERAPCHAESCDGTSFPSSYAHVASSLCSDCATSINLEHRTGDCACLANLTSAGDVCESDETDCDCLKSRDSTFCTTCVDSNNCGACCT